MIIFYRKSQLSTNKHTNIKGKKRNLRKVINILTTYPQFSTIRHGFFVNL